MFVVDLMHEFELGVWKALFVHLLRILHAADKDLVHELDRRYVSWPLAYNSQLIFVLTYSFRQVPTFGADTIRRFSNNVSELKKLAARDFEDLLQVGTTWKQIRSVLTGSFQSAPYPFLTVFFLSHIIASFFNCSSFVRIGMG